MRSALFARCICGGTSWNFNSALGSAAFKSSEYSLSIMYDSGATPAFTDLLFIIAYAAVNVAAYLFLIA